MPNLSKSRPSSSDHTQKSSIHTAQNKSSMGGGSEGGTASKASCDGILFEPRLPEALRAERPAEKCSHPFKRKFRVRAKQKAGEHFFCGACERSEWRGVVSSVRKTFTSRGAWSVRTLHTDIFAFCHFISQKFLVK